jgi:hypothetical protein
VRRRASQAQPTRTISINPYAHGVVKISGSIDDSVLPRLGAADLSASEALGRVRRTARSSAATAGRQAGIGFGCHSSTFVPSGSRM